MGSPSIPAAPPAPTYTNSAREGIYADIETLPQRRAIENAARMGKIVLDGQVVTAAQLAEKKAAEQQKLEESTKSGNQGAIEQATLRLAELNKASDFSGMGDLDYARQAADLASEQNAITQRDQLKLRGELGVKNAEQTRAELEASDPTAFRTREELNTRLRGDLNKPEEKIASDAGLLAAAQKFGAFADQAPGNDGRMASLYGEASRLPGNDGRLGALYSEAGGINTASDDLGQLGKLGAMQDRMAANQGSRPVLDDLRQQAATSRAPEQLGSIYDQATQLSTRADDPTAQIANLGVMQALQEYQLGSRLDSDSERNLINQARAGQAARGNYLGDAAAVVEATQLGQAGQNLKQQRLQNLMDVQQRAFGQNAQLRGETNQLQQSRLGLLGSLQGQGFGQEQALRGEQANYQTTAEAEQMQRDSQLAAMAAQIFGTGQSMRGETRDAQAQRLGLMQGLAGQDFSQTQQAQAQRLGLMQGLAGQDFGQTQQAYNTRLNAQGQALNAAGTVAAENRNARNETLGRSQQNLANVSAMVLGQPITNQFGSLQGAQNGAVGYTSTAYQGGTGLNQNAAASAANFAQGNYGTSSNNWNTSAGIAAKGSPWMALAGQGLGAAAGAGGAALGAMI